MTRQSSFFSAVWFVLISVILCICIANQASAQESFRITGLPGYLLLNSDDVTVADNDGNQTWVFGLGLSNRQMINDAPFDFSAEVSFGQTSLIQDQAFSGINSTDLRYQSVALSVLRVFKPTDIVEFSAGVNLVPQYRTLIYDHSELDLGKDRLLSFGAGLSGKLSLVELPGNDNGIRLVMSLAARWTNFFIHNARNRQIDGFRYNHLIVSPQLSVQF